MLLSILDSNWLEVNLARIIWTAIVIFTNIIIYIILKFIESRIKRKASNRAKGLTRVIANLIYLSILFVSAVIVLDLWEFDTKTVTIILGISVAIIGAGAFDIIRDLFVGVGNAFANLYDEGDVIEINGFKGTVKKISITKTTLLGKNGALKTFSSSKIREVINYSRSYSSLYVDIVVDYHENIDRVINILEEKLPSLKDDYTQILEGPIINGVEDMDQNNIVIRISAKTTPEHYLPVKRGINRKIIEIFKEKQIKFGNKWGKYDE